MRGSRAARASADRHGRGREAGFTLIEVMVALLLTVVAVIGVVALYLVETRASGYSRHETEASVLAEDKMEVLRTITPPTAGSATGSDTLMNEAEQIGSGMYTRMWSIQPDVTPAPNYWTYSVIVSWSEDGIARSVSEVSRY